MSFENKTNRSFAPTIQEMKQAGDTMQQLFDNNKISRTELNHLVNATIETATIEQRKAAWNVLDKLTEQEKKIVRKVLYRP